MASQVVEMDYDVMQAVAKGFDTAAETCRGIAKVLQTLVTILKANFFLRMFYEAVIRWLEGIQKALENLAKVCEEFGKDLRLAVQYHKQGDVTSIFGEGIS
jgi:uncharacterized protein YukE